MIKRSPIWKMPPDDFKQLVANSTTFKQILTTFGFSYSNLPILKKRLKEDNIDYSHIPQGLGANRGRRVWDKPAIPKEELFIENSTHQRSTVKRYIIKNNLIPYKCALCVLTSEWNGKPLVLRLDHINGKNGDHRLENLRFVCPNCDSQLETYGSKNGTKRHNCEICGIKITPKSKYCVRCANNRDRTNMRSARKAIRPSKKDLMKMIWEIPTITIAKQFNVSDQAVAKWCKSYGIVKPGPGYWAKLANQK